MKKEIIDQVPFAGYPSEFIKEDPEKWTMLSKAISLCKKFKFENHSTSNTIQLTINSGNINTETWFDYSEWNDFLKFINSLSNLTD